MNKRMFFIAGSLLLLAGIIAIVVVLVMPMPGQNSHYRIGSSQAYEHQESSNVRPAKPILKQSQRVSAIGSTAIKLLPNEMKPIKVILAVRDKHAQNVSITARADEGLFVENAEQLLTPNENNQIIFESNVSASSEGRFYITFDVAIHTAQQTIASSPTGVVVVVGEPNLQKLRNISVSEESDKPRVHIMPAQETIETLQK